jgi:hypothetical protein
MEKFKEIPSFPDYLVSNYGRVKTKARKVRYTHAVTKEEHFRLTNERFLKMHYNNLTGYKFYQLYSDKKMYNRPIHSLVAEAFLPDKMQGYVVNHKDGNKHNNIVENLEWCSNEYNHEHATSTGLKAKGEEIGNSKLNDRAVHAIKWFLRAGVSHTELSKAFKVDRTTITLISLNQIWKHIALTGEELQIKP